jgi:hypothetical protein
MKLEAIIAAPRSFMKTREGLRLAFSTPGFMRHVQSVVALVDAFAPEDTGGQD